MKTKIRVTSASFCTDIEFEGEEHYVLCTWKEDGVAWATIPQNPKLLTILAATKILPSMEIEFPKQLGQAAPPKRQAARAAKRHK